MTSTERETLRNDIWEKVKLLFELYPNIPPIVQLRLEQSINERIGQIKVTDEK